MTATQERYATLAELQARVTDRDAAQTELYRTLAAASQAVEEHCHRVFTLASSTSARVYRPESSCLVPVDDIADVTGLVVEVGTDGTFPDDVTADVWTSPPNAIAKGSPVTAVESLGAFPRGYGRPTVQVTALWGWPAVPADVTEAVLILGSRLWMRRQSPTGITGAGEFGVVRVSRQDPDVVTLLANYVRSVF